VRLKKGQPGTTTSIGASLDLEHAYSDDLSRDAHRQETTLEMILEDIASDISVVVQSPFAPRNQRPNRKATFGNGTSTQWQDTLNAQAAGLSGHSLETRGKREMTGITAPGLQARVYSRPSVESSTSGASHRPLHALPLLRSPISDRSRQHCEAAPATSVRFLADFQELRGVGDLVLGYSHVSNARIR